MSQEHKQLRWKLLLTVALASTCLVIALAGTAAWLTSDRSLTTLTKIDITTLTLEGQTDDSVPINLGEMELEKGKEMPFRIVSKRGATYKLQLAHTQNLPLNYVIYTANEWDKRNETAPIKASNAPEATYPNDTYTTDEQQRVQSAAEPLYWISDYITVGSLSNSNIDYYVLEVSWKSEATKDTVIHKDTEMIYLSASLVNGGTNNAEPTQSPQS